MRRREQLIAWAIALMLVLQAASQGKMAHSCSEYFSQGHCTSREGSNTTCLHATLALYC